MRRTVGDSHPQPQIHNNKIKYCYRCLEMVEVSMKENKDRGSKKHSDCNL